MTFIPNLQDILSPAQRKTAYTIFAYASAAIFIVSVALAAGGIVTPLVLTILNAGVNGFGIVMGFVARDNTPVVTPLIEEDPEPDAEPELESSEEGLDVE